MSLSTAQFKLITGGCYLCYMIKNIWIDLDDTLWATQENNRDTLEELYHLYGWDRVYPTFADFFDIYLPNNIHQWDLYRDGKIDKYSLTINRFAPVLEPLGYDSDEKILELSEEFLERTATKKKVMPGALELMEHLHSLYTIIIISNGFCEVQHRKMESSGLLAYVDHVILSEDAEAPKPSKRIFDYGFATTGARRSESILIGDAWIADIHGAEVAGMPAIWYNPSGTPRPAEELRTPVYEVRHLRMIPNILRSLISLKPHDRRDQRLISKE